MNPGLARPGRPAGRGRSRPSPAGRPGFRTAAGFAAALLAFALVVQLLDGEQTPPQGPVLDEVRAVELTCPPPVADGPRTESTYTMVAPPPSVTGAAVVARPGIATLADLDSAVAGPSAVRARLREPGRTGIAAGGTPVAAGPPVARGTGSLAPGLAADLLTRAPAGPVQGLAGASCVGAGTTSWFAGASTVGGRRSRLILANPESTPALVDLQFWNAQGPIEAPANSTGIDVPAAGIVEIPLEGMTAGHVNLAMAVSTQRGRVAAFVHDVQSQGVQPRGLDWIAGTPLPRRTVVIPGLPPGAKVGRTLHVLVPGSSDAVVKVRVLTKDNDFAPAGLDEVEIPGGTVRAFDLGPAVGSSPSALVVSADRPVVATVRLNRRAGSSADVAYAAAALPLRPAGSLGHGQAGAGTINRLILAVPGRGATVRVSVLRPGGGVRTQTVAIAAGRIRVLDPGAGIRGPYSVIITVPADAPAVYAARLLIGSGADLTVTAVPSGRFTVAIPDIRADVTAVLP